MQYISGMDAAAPPLPPAIWDAPPAEGRALILALPAQVVALQTEVAALQEQRRELEARLGQDSSKSSRPPSSDPPCAPRKPHVSPTGRRRGGQPRHSGRFRSLLPVEQVDEVVVIVPDRCHRCQQPLPSTETRRQGQPWRHQVVELLPLAVRVTEYQMDVRRCAHCGHRTRAALPDGVPRRPFGPRLVAVLTLLTGRYRLGRRDVRQVLQDLWGSSSPSARWSGRSRPRAPPWRLWCRKRGRRSSRRMWSTWTKPAGGRRSNGPGCGRR